MTAEELDQAFKEVNDQIDELPKSDVKLTSKQWRLQHRLFKQKDILEKIRKSKETQNTQHEIILLAQYNVLKDASTRHPIINFIMQLKLRSIIWG
jgi:phosphoenolpyruvate-protein kinase (PTS system EI component)